MDTNIIFSGGSILKALDPHGAEVDLHATTGGNLKISIKEIDPGSGLLPYNYIQSEETSTYKYYGFAASFGYKIKRKTLATGIWEVNIGTSNYNTAWLNRETLTYTYY